MTHTHDAHRENEKKTLTVILFTVAMMAAEIAYGYRTGSMALLADGYHMGTHALAFGLTYAAYVLARLCAGSDKFPNGTDKIGTLAAYTSALFLGLTGGWIIVEAVQRLLRPVQIRFDEALSVAVIGLVVNAVCIYIMESGHHHEHDKDTNFKAAYYHILADILTSVLAIAALIAGRFANAVYFDALIGVLGGALILKWTAGLLKSTVANLVDMKTA